MNILNRLTVKSLKMNKKRTLVTIFGIILSAALLCAAAGLVTSIQKTLVESAKRDYGNYHAGFPGVLKENLGYVQENRKVKDFYCIEGLGYAKLPESKNEDKPYLYVMAFDETAMENAGLTLIEGRMPQGDTELVITQTIQTNGGVDYQIGDVLTLSVGKRESEGYKLTQQNPYLGEENSKDIRSEGQETETGQKGTTENANQQGTADREHLMEEFQKEYTVVGIMERPNYTIEPYSAPGYSVITKMDAVQETADIYVNFYQAQKANQYALAIEDVLKKYQNWDQEAVYNRQLLRWEGNVSDDTKNFLFAVGGVVIAIIMISSIFVIRNSFAISITERMKQYGMFASVGATSKQIWKNVLFEGVLLGMVGIPLGILSGILAVVVLIQVVNYILSDYLDYEMIYCVPILPIVMAVILSIVTIYFSALSSARKASKVSPMEAIRSNQDIKITAKKVKSPKSIKKLFGVGGEIAYKNLKRNKRKYRTTVISMVVSIVLFLSMYSFIEYGFRYSGAYYSKMDYNLGVALYYAGDIKEEYQIYQDITGLDGIEAWSIIRRNMEYDVSVDQYLSDLGKEIMGYHDRGEQEQQSRIVIVSVGEQQYKKYMKSLGIKETEKQGAVLIENKYHYLGNKKVLGNFYEVREGDTVRAVSDNGKRLSLNVLKVTQECPMGMQNQNGSEGFFLVSDKKMDQIGYQTIDMKIQAEEPYELERKINEELEEIRIGDAILEENRDLQNYNIINLAEEARRENSVVLVIEIFLYGFITVITLIGITNIFNTITTNMELRAREFAMLRSIGMTGREFSGMIRIESIFYGAKALFIGLPVGTACSFLFFKMFDNHMEMKFIFPWKAYVMVIIFVTLIVGLTMKYSFSKIKNKNMIETIRKDTM